MNIIRYGLHKIKSQITRPKSQTQKNLRTHNVTKARGQKGRLNRQQQLLNS